MLLLDPSLERKMWGTRRCIVETSLHFPKENVILLIHISSLKFTARYFWAYAVILSMFPDPAIKSIVFDVQFFGRCIGCEKLHIVFDQI
jgi:hypothetical protein